MDMPDGRKKNMIRRDQSEGVECFDKNNENLILTLKNCRKENTRALSHTFELRHKTFNQTHIAIEESLRQTRHCERQNTNKRTMKVMQESAHRVKTQACADFESAITAAMAPCKLQRKINP